MTKEHHLYYKSQNMEKENKTDEFGKSLFPV